MLTLGDIIGQTGGTILRKGPESFRGISIDTRTICPDDLFLALPGSRSDGHAFVPDALQKARGAIVGKDYKLPASFPSSATVVAVNDPLGALHLIAKGIRNRFPGRVVGIAGSNGKTTTKELTASVLGVKFSVLRTEGNLNNHIGMPLSMTSVTENTDVMVLEIGTNHPGEVAALCAIARPDTAIITNIGEEHLEGFGSLAGVRDAELEILPSAATVIANGDDAFLMEGIRRCFRGNLHLYGLQSPGTVLKAENFTPGKTGTGFTLRAGSESVEIRSPLFGRFNLFNILAAATAGYVFGLSLHEIRQGIEMFNGCPMRFTVFTLSGASVIYDVYNANPTSMEAAVRELAAMKEARGGGRTIAVLGDMFELGAHAVPAHERIASFLGDHGVDIFIAAGALMSGAAHLFPGVSYTADTAAEAGHILETILSADDIVLIKGSRGMAMERALGGFDVRLHGSGEH